MKLYSTKHGARANDSVGSRACGFTVLFPFPVSRFYKKYLHSFRYASGSCNGRKIGLFPTALLHGAGTQRLEA